MLSPETKKFKIIKISALIGLCLLSIIIGCGGTTDENANPSPKEIVEFSLGTVSSPGTFVGTIKGETIEVSVPYGTDVVGLVATFTITGERVEVYSVVQTNGESPNDFTDPVVYTVVGDDGSKQNYTVTVTAAPSSAKEIKTFSLGTVSSPDKFVGTINEAEKTIAVITTPDTDVAALVATFTTTGKSVSVGLIVQTTGVTPNNFTNPVVYTVTAADASTTIYTVTVTIHHPATAISVSMTPNNSGTDVAPGEYCVRTPSITGSYVVTDPDGGSVIVTEWYDNGVLKQRKTITLPSGVTSGFEIYTKSSSTPFLYHHVITFKAFADGVPSNTASSKPFA